MVSGGEGGKGGGGVWSWNGWVLCTIMVVQFVRSHAQRVVVYVLDCIIKKVLSFCHNYA